MSEFPSDDRRRHPRVPVGIIVRIESPDGARRFYSKDISAGGVFLLAEDPLLEETRVELEMYLPLVNSPVRAKGEVVWKQRQGPSGFAIQFTDISDAARDLIRWVVDRYMGVEPV
jgi:uncharacterized protein (TIGR02266 family)